MATITFYDQSLKSELQADVLESRPDPNGFWLRLDQTLFYPEGGGMLRDRGTIQDLEVLDLKKESGEIWHLVPSQLTGRVQLKLDLEDRLERMQVHSSQHLVSALFIDEYHIDTLSHHYLGNGLGDLELTAAELSEEQLKHVEQLSNETITRDLPFEITYLSKEEARGYAEDFSDYEGLDQYRLVTIPGIDHNLCGCPHVPSTHYLKGVNLLRWERIHDHVRLTLACGDGLIRQAHAQYDMLSGIAASLTTKLEESPEAVARLQASLRSAMSQAGSYKDKYLALYTDGRIAAADRTQPCIMMEHHKDLEFKDIQYIASRYSSLDNLVTIGVAEQPDGRCNFIIARSANLTGFSAGAAFQKLRGLHGIKGGGNPAVAQGGGSSWPTMEEDLLKIVKEALA